jgi:hypothetical protein
VGEHLHQGTALADNLLEIVFRFDFFLEIEVLLVEAGAFALDAQAREYAIQPWDEVTVHHNCFTAYYEGAQIASTGIRNLYDDRSYFRAWATM